LLPVSRLLVAREKEIFLAVEMVLAIYFVVIVMVDATKYARKLIVTQRIG
jgi:hypothetical protein